MGLDVSIILDFKSQFNFVAAVMLPTTTGEQFVKSNIFKFKHNVLGFQECNVNHK